MPHLPTSLSLLRRAAHPSTNLILSRVLGSPLSAVYASLLRVPDLASELSVCASGACGALTRFLRAAAECCCRKSPCLCGCGARGGRGGRLWRCTGRHWEDPSLRCRVVRRTLLKTLMASPSYRCEVPVLQKYRKYSASTVAARARTFLSKYSSNQVDMN